MKANFLKVFAVMFVIFMVGACSGSSALEVGQEAPDFTTAESDGKDMKLTDFKGKVIILNFFATWCPPCRSEIPDFIELQKAYGDQGLAIIGVSKEDVSTVKNFVESAGINYAVFVDTKGVAYDVYGPIRGVPTTFIIDKDFKIRQIYIGARPRPVFEKDIKELLK